MKDHTAAAPRVEPRVIGIRELKTHAARILRHVRETRASYVVTHRGRAVGLILPAEPTESSVPPGEETSAAWDTFLRAGRRLQRRYRPGVSGVALLSNSRR
jgi:prevent-host-death family protein